MALECTNPISSSSIAEHRLRIFAGTSKEVAVLCDRAASATKKCASGNARRSINGTLYQRESTPPCRGKTDLEANERSSNTRHFDQEECNLTVPPAVTLQLMTGHI